MTRWHEVEEAWKDASIPLPATPAEEHAELSALEASEAREAELEGRYAGRSSCASTRATPLGARHDGRARGFPSVAVALRRRGRSHRGGGVGARCASPRRALGRRCRGRRGSLHVVAAHRSSSCRSELAGVGEVELLAVPDAVGLLGRYDDVFPRRARGHLGARRALPGALRGRELAPSVRVVPRPGGGGHDPRGHGRRPARPLGLGGARPGRLPEGLEALGVGRDDVDIVFLTHLHIDHLGWNTDREASRTSPVRATSSGMRSRSQGRVRSFRTSVAAWSRSSTASSRSRATSSWRRGSAFEAPGHYPGHMALRRGPGGRRAPRRRRGARRCSTGPSSRTSPTSTARSRSRRAGDPAGARRPRLVACGHYPGSGIGRVVSRRHDRMGGVRARQPVEDAPCRAEGSTTLAGCPGRGTTRSSIASGR